MSSVLASTPPTRAVDGSFEISHLSADGAEFRVPLVDVWSIPFENGGPVRSFAARKGQRHLSGLWWCATTGGHVGFESWLERDHVVGLDFDRSVVGIASQPFWLHWSDTEGRRLSHAPDFFARRADGSAVVIDCRPAERRPPRDVAKFDASAAACASLGWQYRLVGATDPVVTANLRWLAGYRHPRHWVASTATALLEVFSTPLALTHGAGLLGDPLAVLPVLFHLLWRQDLTIDVSVSLHDRTLVNAAPVTR